MRRRVAAAILPLIACAIAVAQDQPAAAEIVLTSQRTAGDAVAEFLSESGAPGISVAVRRVDGSIWAEGYGRSDVENEVAVTERSVFRLASIAKPITATIAMRLAARGALDLDAPVHTFVPQWPEKRWPVTTRQLLGHLGGVRHYRRGESLSNHHFDSVPEALAIFADDPLIHEPGTSYRYTTFGYNLAGGACVVAGEKSFRELLEQEVASLAGCTELQVDDFDRLIPHRAQGYRLVDGDLRNAPPVDTSNKLPGGGLCATATDLVRFAGALLDGTLLDETDREVMWTERRTRDGEGTGYALGWKVGQHDDRRVVWHTGGQPRVSTILAIDVERGTAVALLCNLEGQGAGLRRLAWELAVAELPR